MDAGIGCGQAIIVRGFPNASELWIAPFVVPSEELCVGFLARACLTLTTGEHVVVTRGEFLVRDWRKARWGYRLKLTDKLTTKYRSSNFSTKESVQPAHRGPDLCVTHQLAHIVADCTFLPGKVNRGLDLWEVDVAGPAQGTTHWQTTVSAVVGKPRPGTDAQVGVVGRRQRVAEDCPLPFFPGNCLSDTTEASCRFAAIAHDALAFEAVAASRFQAQLPIA